MGYAICFWVLEIDGPDYNLVYEIFLLKLTFKF